MCPSLRPTLTSFAILLALAPAAAAQTRRPAPPKPVPVAAPVAVQLRVALVGADLSVRPVPLTGFYAVGSAGDTVKVETDLDGRAQLRLVPGAYRIGSLRPVEVGQSRYRWALPVEVTAATATVELTSRNATVEAVTAAPTSNRRVSEEAQIFERLKSGVFIVYGTEGRGSGFLVDSTQGLVLTNAHVLTGTDEARVQLNPTTKVRARIVSVDRDRDVAVLAIPMSRCTGCTVLPLAEATGTEPVTMAGERVLAIGSPLRQSGLLTTGIVSKVEPRAILSDVTINPGNSGGPMLNLDGRVIGLTTFGDGGERGAGIAGVVPIAEARAVLDRARASDELKRHAPSDSLLPNIPATPYPIGPLRTAAAQKKLDMTVYNGTAGPFNLWIRTPPVIAWLEQQERNAVQGRRRQRESAGAVAADQRVDSVETTMREWDAYVGQRRPVVMLNVWPRPTQTGGSVAAQLLVGGPAVLVYKGDFQTMRLMRDTVEVVPTERYRNRMVMNVSNRGVRAQDMAYEGYFSYLADDFAPNANGTHAKYTLIITDTAHPDKPVKVNLSPQTVRAIWRDFAPYRAMTASSAQ